MRRWASRAGGAIGMFMAVIYLAVIIGAGSPVLPSALWFAIMTTAALLAWFADSARPPTGRRMAQGAMVLFLVIGALSTLGIGLVYLSAAILCLAGFAGVETPASSV